MSKTTFLRACLAFLMIVMGTLQAWDSDIADAGFGIVLLVSIVIALPAIAFLIPLSQGQFLVTFGLAFALLVIARIVSSTPLPGLFLVIFPAGMGLIFTGLYKPNAP